MSFTVASYAVLVIAAYIFYLLWRREKEKRSDAEDENKRLKLEVVAHENRQKIEDDIAMGDMPIIDGMRDPNQRD